MSIAGMAIGAWFVIVLNYYLLRVPVTDFTVGWAVGCTAAALMVEIYGRR